MWKNHTHTEERGGNSTSQPSLVGTLISLWIQVVAPKWLCGPNTSTSVCVPLPLSDIQAGGGREKPPVRARSQTPTRFSSAAGSQLSVELLP